MRSSACGGMPGPSSSTIAHTSSRLGPPSAVGWPAARRKVTRTSPPGFENEQALSMRLVITCARRESWPSTTKSVGRAAPRRSTVSFSATPLLRGEFGDHRDHRLGELDEIDRAGVAAREFGVEPRGVGDVADQPVEPAHVVLHDLEQTIARRAGFDPRQRFHRAAQRGQRVLQFVRDVGGEALDRVDAVVERLRHVAQRAATDGRSRRSGR